MNTKDLNSKSINCRMNQWVYCCAATENQGLFVPKSPSRCQTDLQISTIPVSLSASCGYSTDEQRSFVLCMDAQKCDFIKSPALSRTINISLTPIGTTIPQG